MTEIPITKEQRTRHNFYLAPGQMERLTKIADQLTEERGVNISASDLIRFALDEFLKKYDSE